MTLRADDEARTTIEIITEFLAAIFEGTQEPKFFQTLANDAGDADEAPNKKSILTDQVANIAHFVRRHDRNRRGTFFCVATIAKGSSTRNKDNCSEITVAHTDLDFRSIAEDEPTIRSVLLTLPIPPSIVVFSGGGLHLYWLLKEPLPAQQYRERIEALNRKLASVLAGDLQATDVCRLMRLPGTTNSKHGDVRKVRIERLEPDRRYDFDELEETVAGWRPLLTAKEAPAKDKIGTQKAKAKSYPSENPFLKVAEEQGWKPPLDVEQALASMTYPGNVHDTQIRVCASLMKAGHAEDDVVQLVLEATMNAKGVDFAKWDWPAEEKAIRGHCRSAVAKFVPAVSRETPQKTASVAGKGAGIGVAEVGNVVPFSTGKKRKAATPKGDHQLQAAFLVADGLIETLRRDGQDIMLAEGDVWLYRDGFWRVTTAADEQQLRTIIQQGFEDLGEAAKGNTLTLAWKRLIEHPKLYKANVPWAGAGMIVCRNGVISPDIDAPDGWRFEAHKPENYARRHIGAEYDPGVDCPQFVALLESMFSDRLDAHLAISLIQEWLGGALAVATLKREQRRAMIPVGPSRTGKTELTMICKALLGNPIATPSAKEFGERFGLETLYGAVAWIRDDAINEGDRLDPQRFKTVVTGEAVDIDRKNKPAVRDVRLDIPVLLTANSLARVRDSTDAVFNRSIILTMTNVISIEAAHAARVAARRW